MRMHRPHASHCSRLHTLSISYLLTTEYGCARSSGGGSCGSTMDVANRTMMLHAHAVAFDTRLTVGSPSHVHHVLDLAADLALLEAGVMGAISTPPTASADDASFDVGAS